MTRRPTYEELERRIKELEKEAGKRKEVLRKYQFMIESANDAIFLKDLGSRYITANDKTLGVFGLSREDIIGKNDYELMPDQKEAKKNVHDDQIVFKSGKPKEVFKHMTGADGKKYWFQAIKVPQVDYALGQGKKWSCFFYGHILMLELLALLHVNAIYPKS
jgi:PAS domain S-box-containing protein